MNGIVNLSRMLSRFVDLMAVFKPIFTTSLRVVQDAIHMEIREEPRSPEMFPRNPRGLLGIPWPHGGAQSYA